MVAGNKKNRSSRRVGHGKGDGYALSGFEEAQNCPTTRRKSRGRLRRRSSRTPGKEEFGSEGKGQQEAEGKDGSQTLGKGLKTMECPRGA